MVRDGQVLLIDVMFVQVRPSPWRQAVDLANMMLVLAVRTDAPRVYERALQFFSPDEIAEGFAAARGVASPTQLRSVMKQDGRDLLSEFRALAPERRPISLQRWSFKRVALVGALIIVLLLVGAATKSLVTPGQMQVSGSPDCGTNNVMVLMAQSVPSAERLPCLAALPAGWELGGVLIRDGSARFWLDSDRAGGHAVEVRLRPEDECNLADTVPVPSDEPGIRRHERPEEVAARVRGTRFYVVPGGCVTYEISLDGTATAPLVFDIDNALAFQDRQVLVEHVSARTGLRLCGAGVPCPGGS
jgi:hypothetical protein